MIDIIGSSMLYNTAFVEDIYFVRVDYLSYVMTYYHHCSTLFDSINRVFDLFGGYSVETCRRFVEEYYGRIFQEHTRNSYALLLATAQI